MYQKNEVTTGIFLLAGVALLVIGLQHLGHAQTNLEPNYDDTQVREAVGLIFQLVEGAFGALVMVIAGIIAIVSAALGSYRSAMSMLVVAIGAFILRAMVSLFFGTAFSPPTAG